MGRIVAVDYGKKRCGVALTDPLRLSVNTRPVVDPMDLLDELIAISKEDEIDIIVLTESQHANGTANTIQADIIRFAERLKKELPTCEIAFQDEYGSSKEARQLLRVQGVGKKARSQKGALDSVSAGIILERYLRDSGIW